MNEHVKKTRQGFVVSNMMDKTIVVVVERIIPHKLYGKYIKQQVRYMAHDSLNQCQIGDLVQIEECRPLSKKKRWLVRNIVERAA
jgi:small subunit ribosomal protein S17